MSYKYHQAPAVASGKWLENADCRKMLGPISVWAMGCLESIPVFRNKPRNLINTFRMSVEAMQAGDNLLIFL